MTTITIREKPNNTQNEYFAPISFNKDEFPCTIKNPCTNAQVSDLEWYFREYPPVPDEEDQERAKSVAANIKKCGRQLFEQVFKSDFLVPTRRRGNPFSTRQRRQYDYDYHHHPRTIQ